MADWITYKLKGAEELSRVFRGLPQELQRQVMLPAMRDGMDIVLKDAINRASIIDRPETIPDISKNIAMVEDTKYFSETGSTKISVGVRKTRKGQRGGNTFYWWWVELGDSRSRAQPFLRNALAQNRQAVFAELISSGKYQLIKLGLN
jgi:HK97 gp10 family phage protein